MALPIPKPSWDDVKNLREALKRKNLGHLFPNAHQRQRTYNEQAARLVSGLERAKLARAGIQNIEEPS